MNDVDLCKFILIRDNTGNRTIEIESVKLSHLQSWRNKESLVIWIHIYSLCIANGTMFKDMKKMLILPVDMDRAGAETQLSAINMVAELKQLHGNHYVRQPL
jgi:hypothetical protein